MEAMSAVINSSIRKLNWGRFMPRIVHDWAGLGRSLPITPGLVALSTEFLAFDPPDW